ACRFPFLCRASIQAMAPYRGSRPPRLTRKRRTHDRCIAGGGAPPQHSPALAHRCLHDRHGTWTVWNPAARTRIAFWTRRETHDQATRDGDDPRTVPSPPPRQSLGRAAHGRSEHLLVSSPRLVADLTSGR